MVQDFLLTLLVFLGIDAVWLGLLAKKFYEKELSGFGRTLNWFPAIVSYFLIVLGLVVFVFPKVKTLDGIWVFLWGAVYGLIVYGVYDLVNLSTLVNWTLKMTVVDMLWGAFVCGVVTLIVNWII